ncbi:acyltransferase [Nesterenkonia sp. NBAIMH1]|uniref:acyltransferase family protein n=1 Tax=Nesterenkonia sp. NBAIMH1 TaxID=2600320 RepID=UPI0011B605E2|nr:acyltransferase [Nesterenkonia sp. NBAIMH1]
MREGASAATARAGTDAPAGPRMDWMDALRGVAVLLVVVLHAAGIPRANGAGIEAWTELNMYLEPFRMPLLMFLSGMLLPRSLSKPVSHYLWGKFAAIVWPLALWLVSFGVLIYHGGPGDLSYWLNGDYLWFLMALVLCYAAALALRPGTTALAAWMLPACAALIGGLMLVVRHAELTDLLLLNRTLYYGAFFFLGAAAVRLVNRWVKAPVAVVMVLAVYAGTMSHLAVDDRALRLGSLYAAPTALAGIAVALWVAPRICRLRMMPDALLDFLTWCGRNSIVIYVAHFPVIILIHRLMRELGASPLAYVTACTVGGLIITLLIAAARPWTPWLYVFPRAAVVSARLSARSAARASETPAPTLPPR